MSETNPVLDHDLKPEELDELRERCFRSSSEFARVFLPDWFPLKMPWFHRGILALVSGKTEFLLDFGPEVWRDEVAEWTHADLRKILTNFVTQSVPGDPESPTVPIFSLEEDPESGRLVVRIVNPTKKIAVILPRGYSKTTIMNLANLKAIVYREIDYILYVSEAAEHAGDQLDSVKLELEDNELLRMVFGDIVAPRQSSKKWGAGIIEPTNNTMMRVAGKGGQVRGKAKRAKRPGRILVDDMEDEESVKSDTQLAAYSKWFFGTLEPAVRKYGQIFMIGTLLAGSGTILNKLEHNDEYTWIRFGAIDRDGDALWPYGNGMTLEELAKKKSTMAAMGELESFYLEYMSTYIDDKTRVFPAGKQIFVSKGLHQFVAISLCCDPAISDKPGADFCGFGVVGMEAGGVKHVLDAYGKVGMPPEDQVDKFFELHFRWLAHLPRELQRHGVESIAYQKALQMAIKADQFRRSQLVIPEGHGPFAGQVAGTRAYFEVEPITHGKTGKDERIRGILKPIYHTGYLTFQTKFKELDEQLLAYPSGKKDLPDVIAMCVKQLDPFSALHTMDSQSTDLTADTLPALNESFGRFAR